jgi:hypothetical protein
MSCSRKHLLARGREFLSSKSLVELLLGDCELRFLLECDGCELRAGDDHSCTSGETESLCSSERVSWERRIIG